MENEWICSVMEQHLYVKDGVTQDFICKICGKINPSPQFNANFLHSIYKHGSISNSIDKCPISFLKKPKC